jgi:hypothetical protein
MSLPDICGNALVVMISWPPIVPAEVQYVWLPLARAVRGWVRA